MPFILKVRLNNLIRKEKEMPAIIFLAIVIYILLVILG